MDFSILKIVRLGKKLKQAEVASSAGITQEYLSLIERNKREPSLENVENICNALDLELSITLKT